MPLPGGSVAGIHSRRSEQSERFPRLRSGGVYTDEVGDAKHRATRPSKLCLQEGLGQRPIQIESRKHNVKGLD